MKFNPYAVLLTTGVLMLATVLFTQTEPTVSIIKAKVSAANESPRRPDTHLASVAREPAASRGDDGRTLED